MIPCFLYQTIKKAFASFSFLLVFQFTYAQTEVLDRKLNISEYSGTVKEFINKISNDENIVFAYSSDIDLNFEIHLLKSKWTLRELLENLFKEKSIGYKVNGNKVLLFVEKKIVPKLSQTVRGVIIDADSKLPLPGVTIVILGTDPVIGTTSDEKGIFRFASIDLGRINIQFSYVGYESKTIPNIEVNSGKEVVLDINLEESTTRLEEVVVRSNRKGQATNDMSVLSSRSISVEETKRYTGSMEDPARVVSSFAGVACTPDGSSDIIVRGNSPKYIQWRLDGIEISSPYHLDDQNASVGALSALNNNLLATSDFYTGAFSSEYGNVLSSIMDVKLRKGNNEKFEAACGIGIMGTDVTFEGPFKKGYDGSFLVNYRYSTVTALFKLGLVDVPGMDHYNYQDLTFKVVLPTKKAGTFSFFGLGGLDGFLMKNSNMVPGVTIKNADISKDFDKGTYLSNLGMTHVYSINSNSFLKTSLSFSSTGMDEYLHEGYLLKRFDSNGEPISDSVINKKLTFRSKIINSVYRSSVTYNNRLNAQNKIQFGVKYTLNTNKYHQNLYDINSDSIGNVTDFDNSVNTLNTFVNWKFNLTDNLSLIAGLHNMNVLLNKKSTLEPRLAINWKVTPNSSIHAGYGKHSIMENVHNYFTKIQLSNGTVVEPNRNLDLLKADHYVLGFETHFTENLVAKLELYYQYLYNLPVENNDTSSYATINEGIDYRYVALVNKGVGENYGVELTIERFFDNNYYYLINTSIFDSKYKTLENVWRNTRYNNNYIINVLCGKEFKNFGKKKNKTIDINVKVLFEGGERYIPLLRDLQGNVAIDPSHDKYWDYKKAYEQKLDNIFALNMSISYKWNKAHATHEIFLDLLNLTNGQARLQEYYDASQPNKIGYLKQFVFLPNIMYRMYF